MTVTSGESEKPAAERVPTRPARPTAWKDLFTFRAQAQPRLELWLSIAAFLAVLGGWAFVAESGLVQPQILPSPLAVISAWVRLFSDGYIGDIAISVARVWAAFLASAVIAIPLGILMSGYRAVTALLEPIIDFVRYLPVPALVPLTLIWLGIGEGSKVTLLWIGTFFQLILLIADDARRVPKEYIETGRTLGASDSALMKDVLLRAMLPNMVDSLRITLGWCWTYLIVAEIVASSSGIGYELWTARRYGKSPDVFAGILTIGIIGLVSDQAIRFLHRRWFRYLN
ncbi:ABC transporter permease [Nordella sp. HKS 07]|uniref:ABC transporter permease n=1 Tax=Nordella sp. HKS 07 TaxID=2712222 RepID=UPI0013E160F0|nr:ABC transporter permease [Nordella sp. HKS 07]QIG49075.1 ABC transporter permease [Nordella sp. HKS 07]